ncbi:AraC family transcriptional regulator [Neptuniibacter halophilus]|uniref:AraC family transcriptional regulator n=1 Tax=Neptuniibacter halophilus TaxID=651666 RepID=UPI0025739713|nr:AraC family transcriptional regulator [Neptuniibacter halophilus]
MRRQEQAPTIRSSALLGFTEHCRQHRLNPVKMLEHGGVTPDALHSRELRIPYEGMVRALNYAAKSSENPLFSMMLSSKVGIEALGPLGLMASHCESIGESLRVIQKYFDIHAQHVTLTLDDFGENSALTYLINLDNIDDMSQITELGLGRALSVLRALAPSIPITGVSFRHPANTAPESYIPIIGIEPNFSAPENRILFPTSFLSKAPAPPSERAQLYFDSFLQQLSESHGHQLQPLVIRLIRELIPAGEGNANSVARLLGLHTRSLQRQLKLQGTDFRTLLEQVRYELAQEALQDPEISLAALARTLGYSELSAFSRAFKRWSGIAPQRWREQAQSESM